MDGEDAEAYASAAAAAMAAAVASLPDPGLHLAQTQLLARQADDDQDLAHRFVQSDGLHLCRRPRRLRKPNDVARCQVDGCGRDLSDTKLYLRRYSVCEPHFKAEWVMLSGGRFRFCQQCNKFQPLDDFSGTRRSCKARSEDRNQRRRKQRTDERATAGDETEGGGSGVAARLLKGAPHLGGLAVPSRAALGDNGVLRQLGDDQGDPNGLMSPLQYANQVQQLLLAGSAAGGILPGMTSGGVGGSAGGPGLQLQVPAGMDLAAAAAALVGGDLSALGGNTPTAANALSLLSAAAAANGATRGVGASAPVLTSLADQSMGSGLGGNVLQQLQLAQLASALSKGSAMGAAGSASGAAAAGSGAGLAASGAGPSAIVPLADTAGLTGGLDLQTLMAQQLLQQTASPGQSQPVLVLHHQNVMLFSLDQLGLLQQQAK